MKNILFLDDSLERTAAFKSHIPSAVCVETAPGCIEQLDSGKHWEVVFLDHDLAGEINCDTNREDTGSEVVRWIIKNKPEVDCFIVHSLNFSARVNMAKNLVDAGYPQVEEITFIQLISSPQGKDVLRQIQEQIEEDDQ